MTPEDLMHDLRSRINHRYAEVIGMESYERKQCADAIELLIEQRDQLAAELAERDALKARLDGGVRVGVYEGGFGISVTFTENKLCQKYNATLILDEGTVP